MILDVYERKCPSFCVAFSKQYLYSQNNIDAFYRFWSAYKQNMKGLIFLFRNEIEINPDQLQKKRSERGWKLAVGKEVEGRVGLLIYLKWGWKKSLQLMKQELKDWYVVQNYKLNQ